MKNIKNIVILSLAASIASGALLTGCGKKQSADAPVEINFLSCWQGKSSANDPQNLDEDIVGKKMLEDINVIITPQYITSSETEKLNVMFASGDMPDLVSAPFWGGSDGSTLIIKKAAKEGMISPLNDYLEEHAPDIDYAFTQNLYSQFIERDLEDPAFNGNKYLIPAGILASPEDSIPEPEMLYIRKDIMEALNVDRNTINTADDVYELLKKINAGSFKDANGQDVIPASAQHKGYRLDRFWPSFYSGKMGEDYLAFTGYYKDENGKVMDDFFSYEVEERCKYIAKLVREGLMDVEAFTHTAARSDEKITNGSVAIVPGKASFFNTKCEPTLYKTHPEMEYVPLNVLKNREGERVQYSIKGSTGSQVLFFPKNNKEGKIIAGLKAIQWLNTDEGRLLHYYGEEGTHYTMANGQPRMNEDVLSKYKADPSTLTKQGLRMKYSNFILRNDCLTKYGEATPGESDSVDPRVEFGRSFQPEIEYVDGVKVNYFEDDYPQIENIRAVKLDSKISETISRAYFAKSDEEVVEILNGYREQLKASGIQGLFDFIQEKAEELENPLF